MSFLHCLLLAALASSAPQVHRQILLSCHISMLFQDGSPVRGERHHPWRGTLHVSQSHPDPDPILNIILVLNGIWILIMLLLTVIVPIPPFMQNIFQSYFTG